MGREERRKRREQKKLREARRRRKEGNHNMVGDTARSVTRTPSEIKLADGRKLELSPLGLQDYTAIEDAALQQFRRRQIETWTQNADLLPDDKAEEMITEAFERAAELTPQTLPQKTVKVPKRSENGIPIIDPKTHQYVMDEQPCDYSLWWMSQTQAGRLKAAYLSLKHRQPDITMEEVDKLWTDEAGRIDEAALREVANRIGELSDPKLADNPTSEGDGESSEKAEIPTQPSAPTGP